MDNQVINLDKYKRGKLTRIPAEALLPKCTDPNIEGKCLVRVTCSYYKAMFGREAYTDYVEVIPGYVVGYFPKLGFVYLPKDSYKEA